MTVENSADNLITHTHTDIWIICIEFFIYWNSNQFSMWMKASCQYLEQMAILLSRIVLALHMIYTVINAIGLWHWHLWTFVVCVSVWKVWVCVCEITDYSFINCTNNSHFRYGRNSPKLLSHKFFTKTHLFQVKTINWKLYDGNIVCFISIDHLYTFSNCKTHMKLVWFMTLVFEVVVVVFFFILSGPYCTETQNSKVINNVCVSGIMLLDFLSGRISIHFIYLIFVVGVLGSKVFVLVVWPADWDYIHMYIVSYLCCSNLSEY